MATAAFVTMAAACSGVVGDAASDIQQGANAGARDDTPANVPEPDPRADGDYAPEQTVRLDLAPTSPQEPAGPTCDLAITQVAAFQSVKRTLWRQGEILSGHSRLIAGKPTLFRVFVTPGPRWPNRLAKARLTLTEPGGSIRTYEVERLMAGVSTDENATSTFNFVITGTELSPQTRYRVDLDLGPDCKRFEASRRVPREGPLPLEAVDVAPLRIVIVPLAYNADRSGRLPIAGEQQLEQLRSAITAMLPVRGLEIKVRQPVLTNVALSDDTFPLLLDQVRALRAADQPPHDVHYMGLVAPTEALAQYCRDTCTAGLAFGNVTDAPSLRVGVAIGYAGADSVRAFVHELGHTLGLRHAPCNTSEGVDAQFPYPGGLVGVWGFDERSRLLRDPSHVSDFMGYCSQPWISDYSYSRIQTRLRSFLPGGAALTVGVYSHEPFVSVYVNAGGAAVVGQVHGAGLPLPETEQPAVLTTADGPAAVTVHRLPMHDGRGSLWMMPAALAASSGSLQLPGGVTLALPIPPSGQTL